MWDIYTNVVYGDYEAVDNALSLHPKSYTKRYKNQLMYSATEKNLPGMVEILIHHGADDLNEMLIISLSCCFTRLEILLTQCETVLGSSVSDMFFQFSIIDIE